MGFASSDWTRLDVRVRTFIDRYNSEVRRYREAGRPKEIDTFLNYSELKWSRNLKRHLLGDDQATFSAASIRTSLYRPFTKRFLYLADILVDEPSKSGAWSKKGNAFICVSGVASAQPFQALVTETPTSLDMLEKTRCLPLYTYNEDGTNRNENITDWALDQYRTHYADPSITKWDIFHSTYALLHDPEYRTRYAANLKRELPRIPFPPDLQAFTKAGKRLMELHIDYEQQPEYPLEEIEQPKAAWTLRVERMSLSKDKTELRYNDALTLRGIPAAAFEYRLGNRSALEWVIDQYRVSTDARSGIVNDPNRADDERYILRLTGQVITVSLETMQIVRALPALGLGKSDPAGEAENKAYEQA
jgi:predicted helicase